MSDIKIESELEYTVQSPTSFVLNIASAHKNHQQTSNEQLLVTPDIPYQWCMLNDSGSRGIRLTASPGTVTINYSATVQFSPELEPAGQLQEVEHKVLPDTVLAYLNPSRYCESDRLGLMAAKEFGHLGSGYFRVQAICDWINQRIDYVSGSTDASSSACDVLIQRAGVCRDFAHVGIALCRALGMPARYVSGYAVDLYPPDFHGLFEVFLNDTWYLFDATRMAPMNGFVRVGMGHDAADTSFANIVGSATLQSMKVSAIAVDFTPRDNVDEAVSSA